MCWDRSVCTRTLPQSYSASSTVEPPPALGDSSHPELLRLLAIVARLRAPGGCPWDREQTEVTMAPHLLEEAFEAVEAIESGDTEQTREELGDVLMNIFMVAQIADEGGRFGIEGVAREIADKLVRRHPHVFGPSEGQPQVDTEGADARQVLANWETIKRQERAEQQESATPKSVLSGLPKSLPALLRAYRIGEKAANAGFDWPDRSGPRQKLEEEATELDQAVAAGDQAAVHQELGDVLFAVVNLARHLSINPEMALRATIDKFTRRFEHVEEQLGDRLRDAPLAEKEELWEEAKGME